MHIKHIWSLLCRRSIIDSETNNISISDVFEQLQVDIKTQDKELSSKKFSINVPIEFEIVSFWQRDESKESINIDLLIKLTTPSGDIGKEFSYDFQVAKGMTRMRSRIKIIGLTLTESGNYLFSISYKEKSQKDYKKVAELPLEVILNNQE